MVSIATTDFQIPFLLGQWSITSLSQRKYLLIFFCISVRYFLTYNILSDRYSSASMAMDPMIFVEEDDDDTFEKVLARQNSAAIFFQDDEFNVTKKKKKKNMKKVSSNLVTYDYISDMDIISVPSLLLHGSGGDTNFDWHGRRIFHEETRRSIRKSIWILGCETWEW